MATRKLVLVSSEALQSLEDSLNGEKTLCRNFVCRYVEMWPHRFTRIHEAIAAGLNDEALDATRSLRSASMMVGAVRLGDLTQSVIHHLQDGDLQAAGNRLMAVNVCGNQTVAQLELLYGNSA